MQAGYAGSLAGGGVTAAAAWWGLDRLFLGLFVGIGLTAVPLLMVQLRISTGIAARELGAEAERWTADALDKLDPRQWKVFHDVPVRWGNVDRVAVGPGRVYAIETTWTTAKGRFREGAAQQAAKQATQLQKELSSRGVDRQVLARNARSDSRTRDRSAPIGRGEVLARTYPFEIAATRAAQASDAPAMRTRGPVHAAPSMQPRPGRSSVLMLLSGGPVDGTEPPGSEASLRHAVLGLLTGVSLELQLLDQPGA